MPLNFSTTAAESVEYGRKALVYGESGVGKTALALTVETPFIINSDKGQLTLRQYNIPMATIYNDRDLTDVRNWIEGSQEARQYRTFFFDSISSVADVMLADALKVGRKDPRLAYGEAGRDVVDFMVWARDFRGFDFVFTAECDYIRDKSGGVIRMQPRLPGKALAPTVAYKFDVVAYMGAQYNHETKQLDRYLQLMPDDVRAAKIRAGFNHTIGMYESPHLGMLFDKLASV